MMENEKIRCKKCRSVLLAEETLHVLDAHGEEYQDTADSRSDNSSCLSLREQNCLYLSEEAFPNFVLEAVGESSWTKGKIYCPTCQARLGSFNFVSGSQCACGSHVLPQVHILRSKIDWMKVGKALPQPVSYPDHCVALVPSALPLDRPPQPLEPDDGDLRGDSHDPITNLVDPPPISSNPSPLDQCFGFGLEDKKDSSAECLVRQRQHSRKREPPGAPSPHVEPLLAQTLKSSCFEVLNDELRTEDSGSSEEEEKKRKDIPDKLVCPVCLDLFYSPLMTSPCEHVFCEPCLRRLAKPNPTSTHCPLCRQVIGHCLPCPELSQDVQTFFPGLYQRRRQYELEHNTQHMPLPWTKKFRLGNAYRDSESWVQRAGGWSTIVMVMSLNILGAGIIMYLGRVAKTQSDLKKH